MISAHLSMRVIPTGANDEGLSYPFSVNADRIHQPDVNAIFGLRRPFCVDLSLEIAFTNSF